MDSPISCLSFSPNWFYPQIVQMNSTLLAYGANEQVYVYDWTTKKYLYQLQAASKVTMLYFHKDLLLVGADGGIVSIFQGQKFLGKVELNIKSPYYVSWEVNHYVLFDERGIGVTFSLGPTYQVEQFGLKLISQPICIPKLISVLVMYQSGRIYDQESKGFIDYPYKIMCADHYGDKFAILNKQNKIICLHVFKRNQLWKWSKPAEPEADELFTEIKFVVNDKYPTENMKKAPLTIQFISDDRILVSTRQGELFIVNVSAAPPQLKLDPQSLQETAYYKVPIEIHLKGVFLQGRFEKMIFTVGTDRRIALLKVSADDLELHWRLVLLSSMVQNIGVGVESNLVFFNDQSLKALDISKKHDPLYVNEFWKIPKVDNFWMHPKIEGLVATQHGQRIDIYNVYKESILTKITCSDPICKVIWMDQEHTQGLYGLLDQLDGAYPSEVQPEPMLVSKPCQLNDYLLIVLFTGKYMVVELTTGMVYREGFIVQSFRLKELILQKHGKVADMITLRVNSLQSIMHNNQCYFIISYNENWLLIVDGDLNCDCVAIHTQQISSIYTCIVKGSIFITSGCNDGTVGLMYVQDTKIVMLGYLRHKYPIERIKCRGNLVLAIAKQHSSLQIWDIQSVIASFTPSREALEGLEKANIRGHGGYLLNAEFYSDTLILTTGEDQTIKVFNVNDIPNTKPPNKKKNKNKKVKI